MYCSKCGRELKDGEVCNCTTNVEKPTIKFSDTVMSTVHFARDLFVNPSETIKSYFSLDYGKMAVKLILLKAVVAFVLVFAVFETLMSSNTVLTYITKSKFELGLFAFGISIFGDLIYGVAISFASRLAHCYLRFKACLQLATVAIPVNMAFMIVAAFAAFINVDASVYVLMFTILPTVALTTMAVSNIKGASENKKIWIVIFATLIISIVAVVLFSAVVNTLNKIERKFGAVFKKIFKTITVDNGSEFADVEGMQKTRRGKRFRTQVFYCHPYCSCERGSNENQNKLIRRHIPKGEDIKLYSKKTIKWIENWINHYPRELFGGRCAEELFQEELLKI